jgi:hypothetical protein
LKQRAGTDSPNQAGTKMINDYFRYPASVAANQCNREPGTAGKAGIVNQLKMKYK